MPTFAKTLTFGLLLQLYVGVSASEFLFNMPADAPGIESSHPEQVTTQGWNIKLTADIEQRLDKGKVLSLSLPGSRYLDGVLAEVTPGNGLSADPGISETRIVSLDSGQGTVEIYLSAGKIRGMLILDISDNQAFKATFDETGTGILEKQKPDLYYCVNYPTPTFTNQPLATVSDAPNAAPAPDLDTLRQLQSRPEAPNILYINYWGGTLNDTVWNSGSPINYTPFSQDSDTTNFSTAERHDMWLGWAEAAEDYAPFNVNVTTDAAVYAATPTSRRVQIIATTTCDWYGCGYGGAAYLGVFGAGDYHGTGWAWNRYANSLGMTISHEAGHQMGLSHDGNSSSKYDSGHGDWGPIMGGAFGKPYVQWSKGEYPDAVLYPDTDKQEDDLVIIRNMLGEVVDEAGDATTEATLLDLPVIDKTGILRPEGLGKDIDVYRFELATDTSVKLRIGPPLGIQGESMGTSLSLKAQLVDASGTQIISLTPSSPPSNNVLQEALSLPAGSYNLILEPLSYDQDWTTGFGEYANGGYYSISIEPELGPDLATIAQPSSPTILSAGQNFEIISTVSNHGDASAAGSVLRYFSADHSAVTPNDTEAIESNTVQPLSPQESIQLSQSMPADMSPGHHWVSSCVDPVTGEQQTANNCSPSIEIIVANGVCKASEEITIQGPLSGFEYRKSGVALTFSDSQLAGELYLEAPQIQLGTIGTVLSIKTGSILSVKSSIPDCQ